MYTQSVKLRRQNTSFRQRSTNEHMRRISSAKPAAARPHPTMQAAAEHAAELADGRSSAAPLPSSTAPCLLSASPPCLPSADVPMTVLSNDMATVRRGAGGTHHSAAIRSHRYSVRRLYISIRSGIGNEPGFLWIVMREFGQLFFSSIAHRLPTWVVWSEKRKTDERG